MKYHIEHSNDQTEAFKKGFIKALELTAKSDTKQMLIKVGILQNAEGIMKNVLGDECVKVLVNKKEVSFPVGKVTCHIYLESKQSLRTSFSKGVIFKPWETLKGVSGVIEDDRGEHVVYVPWLHDEFEKYEKENPDSKKK